MIARLICFFRGHRMNHMVHWHSAVGYLSRCKRCKTLVLDAGWYPK